MHPSPITQGHNIPVFLYKCLIVYLIKELIYFLHNTIQGGVYMKKDLIELVFIIDRSDSMDGLVNILLLQSNAHAQIEPRLRSVSPRLN